MSRWVLRACDCARPRATHPPPTTLFGPLAPQYEGMLVQWPHDAPAPYATFDTCTSVNPWCAAGEPTPSGADYSYCPQASIVPGKQFAYKVRYNDTLDDLDARFGFKQGELCAYNGIKNCSCLSTEGAWLAIPNVANP